MPGAPHSIPSIMDWAVHLRLPPVRVPVPTTASPCAGPACPRTVRRDLFSGPQQHYFRPSAPERFNLVVPTSLIEAHFNVDTVLQRGLDVVFKLSAADIRAGQHSTAAAPATQQQLLDPVHGCVSRHTNPIGLTSYRVSGQQPSGVVPGCSLMGWSAHNGQLVVELATPLPPQQTPAKAPAPAPMRRLFGDCLPSPATIRKEPQPRATAPPPAPQQQQPQQHPQQRREAPRTEPQPAGDEPCRLLGSALLLPAQLPALRQLSAPGCSSTCSQAEASSQGGSTQQAQQQAHADLRPQQQPAEGAREDSSGADSAVVAAPVIAAAAGPMSSRSCEAADAECPASLLSRFDSVDINNGNATQQAPEPAASRRQRGSNAVPSNNCQAAPAQAAASTSATDADPAPARPKRQRRCPDRFDGDTDSDKDSALPSLHQGIDLLLAAHVALSQQEQGRPKRARQPKVIFGM